MTYSKRAPREGMYDAVMSQDHFEKSTRQATRPFVGVVKDFQTDV